ncbi:MAG: phosphate propanoyltransferase [Lachnospiraceae bacterium]|nr:phosphate propanoyltransferase [Lachnospiraceae bacterium]
MSLKIPIEISARHVHMCRGDFEELFGKGAELTFEKELSQPGQYLAKERIDIVGPKNTFHNVAILGPFRSATQVELSITDTRKLGLAHAIRQSGDIADTPGCNLSHGEKSIWIDQGVIVAKRHIHMTPQQAMRLHVRDNEEVCILTHSYERSVIYADVVVRVSKNFRLSMHVDTDEGNAFACDTEPFGVILPLYDTATYSLEKWTEELLEGISR